MTAGSRLAASGLIGAATVCLVLAVITFHVWWVAGTFTMVGAALLLPRGKNDGTTW